MKPKDSFTGPTFTDVIISFKTEEIAVDEILLRTKTRTTLNIYHYTNFSFLLCFLLVLSFGFMLVFIRNVFSGGAVTEKTGCRTPSFIFLSSCFLANFSSVSFFQV